MATRKKQESLKIVNGLLNFETFDGLLFVGDPHITTYKPGLRMDKNFLETSLNKLEQAVEIAKSNNLFMIILGDLFDDDKETDPLMLTKIIKILKKLPTPALSIVGNHEKTQLNLTDDTFLAALREAGVLYTLEGNSFWGRFKFNNDFVYLGGTAYGKQIPNNLNDLFDFDKFEVGSYTMWLTHHDLAIGTFYPGCITPYEIIGCDMVINGHDHTTKEPFKIGQTTYYNPGNILRMTVDKKEHIPQVWKWTPQNKNTLFPIPLKFEKDIFNLIGRQITVKTEEKQINKKIQDNESKFLNLLVEQEKEKNNNINEQSLTTDATFLEKSIISLAQALNTDKTNETEILNLAKECANELKD